MDKLQAAWAAFLNNLLQLIPDLIAAVVIIGLGWLAAKLFPKPIKAMLTRTRLDKVAIKYIVRVLKISIWTLSVVMALDVLGVPVGSLLTLLAAVGAAVALAIKDNLANLASGLVLLFTKPFKAGDYIEVDGTAGTIREIELMHTYLDTAGNTRLAIPNTKMMTGTITNYTAYESRRQDLVFRIHYADDLLAAKALLGELAAEHPLVLKEPEPPLVMINEQGESGISLLLRVWCQNEHCVTVQGDLLEQGKLAFDKQGFSIPYPQMEVHLTR